MSPGTTEIPLRIRKAAKTASNSPHALINLIRLVGSLESHFPGTDDSPGVELKPRSEVELRRDRENLLYSRALLEALQTSSEGSSSSAQTLQSLSKTLSDLSSQYETRIKQPEVALAATVKPEPLLNGDKKLNKQITTPPGATTRTASPAPQSSETVKRRRRKVPSLSEYLSKREKEDKIGEIGGEAGLLPIGRPSTAHIRAADEERNLKDELMAGRKSRSVLGNAEIHEELGGQLAEMSHRLKLNAIHFANSLEDEKELIDSSQQVLEKNLSDTQSSKKHLGAVSRKGRGTTCMTLGIVILVMILFIWTYLLIRLT